MDAGYLVFSVEDDALTQDIIRVTLGETCKIRSFESAEACQEALASGARPHLFLLDVGLPGMDGYTFCNELKQEQATTRDIPVLFVSSHDTLDARLAGYAAGGEDFIVKPFARAELIEKVRISRTLVTQRTSLREQTAAARAITTQAMSHMAESGAILPFLRLSTSLETLPELAEAMLELLESFQLHGAIQTRSPGNSRTQSRQGIDLPLEASIISHARDMGPIYEFRSRCVFNRKWLTVLINDMPQDNPELCARIREHLSTAMDGLNCRLHTLEAEEAHRHEREALKLSLLDMRGKLAQLRQHNTEQAAGLRDELELNLAKAFLKLELDSNDEVLISQPVRHFVERSRALFEQNEQECAILETLNQRLAALP